MFLKENLKNKAKVTDGATTQQYHNQLGFRFQAGAESCRKLPQEWGWESLDPTEKAFQQERSYRLQIYIQIPRVSESGHIQPCFRITVTAPGRQTPAPTP